MNGVGPGATGFNSNGNSNNNIANFFGNNFVYWSSSQFTQQNAFVVNSTTGAINDFGKASNLFSRASRYF
jgi:hypothetical protein